MSNNPTTILTDTSGNQIGISSNPFCISGSLVATITINNYVTVGASGSQGVQGPSGSAGATGSTTPPTGSWRDPGNTFVTTGSVSVDTGNRTASTIGTDIFFFVSGSQNVVSGTNRKIALFGGGTVNSGSILQKNLSVRPTVSPVSGCLFSSHSGSMYRLTSSGSLQVLGEKYITITLPTGSNYTLTPDEYSATIIKFTVGKPTKSTVFVPLIAGNRWVIQALTTTAGAVIVSGPTGATVNTNNQNTTVGCDGTDIFFIKSDADLNQV